MKNHNIQFPSCSLIDSLLERVVHASNDDLETFFLPFLCHRYKDALLVENNFMRLINIFVSSEGRKKIPTSSSFTSSQFILKTNFLIFQSCASIFSFQEPMPTRETSGNS